MYVNITIVILLSILFLAHFISSTDIKTGKFLPHHNDFDANFIFIRVIFRENDFTSLDNLDLTCAEECLNSRSCRRFYVDDGACVFGVYDVIAFTGSTEVVQNTNSDLWRKGIICFFTSFIIAFF